MVGGDVEHLQPCQGVVGERGHALGVDALGRQPVRVTHLWPQLRPRQRQSLPLQGVQPRVEGGERVRPRRGWDSQCPVPGEMLHGVGGRVKSIQLRGLHLEAGLHPLPQLPLADLPLADLPLPQLPLADGGVHVVEAGHVVGQQWVRGVEGHEKRVVSVGGGHDVGPRVLAQRP